MHTQIILIYYQRICTYNSLPGFSFAAGSEVEVCFFFFSLGDISSKQAYNSILHYFLAFHIGYIKKDRLSKLYSN